MTPQLSKIREIAFQLTNECNLSCEFCFADSRFAYENELQLKEIQQIIDYFSNFHLESVVFTGGEPLCRIQTLKKALKHASKQGMTTGIFTNGTLVSKALAQDLKDCDLTWARVSIDGSQGLIHDRFRGEGTFRKAIEGIRFLQELGIDVQFRSTIFKTNYNDFPSILELARDQNVESLWVRPFMPLGRGASSNSEYSPSLSQREKVIRFLLIKRKESDDYPKIVFMPSCFEFLYPEYCSQDSVLLCPCGRDRIFIDCVGNIKPCGPYPEPLGSIRTNQPVSKTIQNTLSHSEVLQEINYPPSNKICAKCNSWDVCRRSCYSITFAMTGSLSIVHPYCPKLSDRQERHGKV